MSLNIGFNALRHVRLVLVLALFSCVMFAHGSDLRVPSQYSTIQAAVDAANPGDTILIAKGTYKGVGNTNIDPHGKSIKIQGSGYLATIIDCERTSRGFIFANGETSSTELRALTIQNGRDSLGGGILVTNGSPAILYCSINDCSADYGGAVAVQAGSPGFVGCFFIHNHSLQGGGAVYTYNSSSQFAADTFDGNDTKAMGGGVAMEGGSLFIVSSIFKDNVGDQGGGAFFSKGGDVAFVNGSFSVNTANVGGGAISLTEGTACSVTNSTFGANLSHDGPGAIMTDDKSNVTVSNSIMWTDGTKELSGHTNVRFSCIAGGATGDGNTADDPRLVDAINHDLHIRIGSACIDKADKSSVVIGQDQDGRDRVIGSGPDMGAYEYPIVRPSPEVAADTNNTFQVPHDGNPDTDTVLATVHGSAFDWLAGALTYLWTCDDKVLGTQPNLSIMLEPGEQVFTLQVRDVTGGFASQKVHVNVLKEANTAPVANAGADQTLTSTGGSVHVTLHGSGYDADGDPLTYSWAPIGSSSQDVDLDLLPGTYTYTLTVTDPYGATGQSQVKIRILDGLGPKVVINGDNPYYLEVFDPWLDPGATATDDVDGANLVVKVYGSVDNNHLGSYKLVYAATDSSGNTGSNTRTVIVRDTKIPVITLKGDNPMFIDCASGYTEPGATAIDNYDGPVPVTISGAVSTSPGVYTITYTASDSSGNVATATRTVTVANSVGPIITLNGANPMTLECQDGYTEPGATAKDGCLGLDLTVIITGTVGTTPGTYTVTYSATNADGLTATATRSVIVKDTKAPIITLNGDNPMTIECGDGYTEPGATATDACDNTSVPVKITGAVLTAKGTYTVTYTATDASGNTATMTRTVNVTDTKPPVITLNGANPMNVECGIGYVEPGATASDGCDGLSVPVTITGSVLSTKGTYTITYNATDSAGNTATATRTVKVVDTTAPVITLNGANPVTVECGSGYTELGAIAIDSCDGPITVNTSGSVSSGKGTYTITYTATDSSGNTATATRTINVSDTTAPVITLNGANPMAVECGTGYVEPGATATDSCDGGSVPVVITGTVQTTLGTYTVTYTATDSSGNSATATRTINVRDTIAPVITINGPNPGTVECGNGYVELGATAADACDGTVAVTTSGTVLTALGTYTITYTATDASGNTSTATRQVNVVDTSAPVITLNGANPMTVECGSGYVEPGATATDGCGGITLPVTITGSVLTSKGTYTVTYSATDAAGNTTTVTRTVNVVDTTGPVITLNGANPMTIECGTGYTEPGATATDACDGGSTTVTITGSVLTSKGTYTVTYTATDSSGNTSTATRTVNVTDTIAPVITLNGSNPMTVQCGAGYLEPGAVAIDACEGSITVSITGSVLTSKGTYTVTYTAKDSSGNTSTKTRTVNVVDTTAPVITLNGSNPMTVECGTGYVEPGATAADTCDGSVTVVITGSVSASKGTYTVTYTATDSSGNTATATRTVNVVDTTGPVITLNGSNPMTIQCGTGYVEPGASATDSCDGPRPVVITGTVLTSKGTYTVTYTSTDSSGNTSTKTRTVNVVDTTAPVITLNGSNPMTVACGSGYVEPGATANDACDGSVTVVITGSVLTSKGTYTVTYKATDSSGNTATSTRTVNVTDTTPPVITLNGSNPMTIQCGSGYVEPGATATDGCDGTVTVVIAGSVLTSKGTYTVTYKATDGAGNTATATRTVNVVDTIAPVITLNGSNPMTVQCGSGYVEPGATATDTCDGSVAVVITGSVLTSKGTYTVTYKATDGSGNSTTVTRTVNVVDTTAPVITLNGSNPMTVQCGSGYVEPGATAIDACDGAKSVTITGSVLTSKGTYTVTYKATDLSGNTATVTRTVNVVDTVAPVITLNGSTPMTIQCGSGYTEPGATATDACQGSVAVVITGSVPAVVGTYTITYTSTDSSGNVATKTRTVNVIDTVAPVITLNGANPLTADCSVGYNEPGATAVDACDGSVAVVITGTVPSAVGTYTVTYTATDSHGNTATATRTVTMTTSTKPSANAFNATPSSIKGGKTTNVNLHYGFNSHCASVTWDVECVASGPAGSIITKIDDNNFTIKAVSGCTYTFTLTITDSVGNVGTATCTVNGT
jgi:hypothetical protein